MYNLGIGANDVPFPQKNTLDSKYVVKMHVNSPILQGQLIEKKISPLTFIVCLLGRVEEMPKKSVGKM